MGVNLALTLMEDYFLVEKPAITLIILTYVLSSFYYLYTRRL